MRVSMVLAYATRHLYLYKRSLPRLMEVFYWPVLDLLVWGFISMYLAGYSGQGLLPDFVAFFVGALILWDVLFRCQQGISVSFLEDMWSRNLLNVFVSPIRPTEYVASLLFISMVKLLLASTVMVVLALILYSYNIFLLGLPLIPLVLNLIIMGWSIGIITTGIILRFGQEAEVLAWGIAFLFQPVSAVFYPVSVLPPAIQTVALFVPSSHVFEGMRQVISHGTFPMDELLWAAGLNVVYIAAAVIFFTWNLRAVKKKGLLAKVGE
jgi:ABC-2 type transport system permease protein